MLTTKNRVRDNLVVILLTALVLLTGCLPPGPRALLAGKRLIEQGKYPQALEQLRTATSLLATNVQWLVTGPNRVSGGRNRNIVVPGLRALFLF